MKKQVFKKISFIILFSIVFLVGLIISTYIFILPNLIKVQYFHNELSKIVQDNCGVELKINNPNLNTSLNTKIDFNIDKLYLAKNSNVLVELDNFKISLDFRNIFNKSIKLNHLLADNLTIKFDELMDALVIKESKTQQKFDWNIDFYNSDINLKSLILKYKQKNNASIALFGNNINLVTKDDYKILNFKLNGKLLYEGQEYIKFQTTSINEIKLYNDYLKISDLDILLNNSKLKIDSKITTKDVNVSAKSDKFYLKDIFNIVKSNILIPNGQELLSPLIDPDGNVEFNIQFKDNNLSGCILIDNTKAKIKDLTSIPLNIQKGKIEITKNKIQFIDLNGYYGKNKSNNLKIYGDIKDYYKTFDSNIFIDTLITNEFLKKYLAPLANNTVLKVSKPVKTRIIYKAKNNIMDIVWLARVPAGVEFSVNNSAPSLTNYNRALKGDFHIEGNIFEIRNINYYIAADMKRGMKISPVLVFDGKTTLDGKIKNLGFYFQRKIPCEFLNIFLGPKTFKKGTIVGKMHIVYKNNIPTLDANMQIENTLIPSQRMFIKYANLKTDSNYINLDMKGGFKKVKYDFNSKIQNKLLTPITIKKINLNIDEMNLERLLASLNTQQNANDKAEEINSEDDLLDDDFMFDTNLIRIEDSDFYIKKGKFKDIEFSEIKAKMTLDKNGILNLASNKFNIAKGISTLKIKADLKKLQYYIRLGVKDVDSNIMTKSILNLENEISGKAKGLIEITTDKSLKLNGQIRFKIEDGIIGKIGVVEYLLKIASVFRNPIVMINPVTIMDIITMPEGKFNEINGDIQLKDNIARKIDIKSYSPTLSALVKGRYDMDEHDASLRIYTRFSSDRKSVFGFLRNVSLNAVANKIQMNSNNDINYYSSELKDLPSISVPDEKAQVFLTEIEGDIEHNNYLSSLKKIK